MLRVGINGLGRIGRSIYRVNRKKKVFDIVVINDINPDLENIAYTLNYDTLYGRLEPPVGVDGDCIVDANFEPIPVYHKEDICDVDWSKHNVDYVIDASGILKNVLGARHLVDLGLVQRVLVTHSPEEVDFTMVLGANEADLDLDKHFVISSSICDATALAPVLKLVNEEFKIENGYVTTLHPWLSYQNLMDGPSSSWSVPGEIYHHFALGRSAIGNMIPKPTSAINATCKVVKGIDERRIGSFSYRTPTAIIGTADVTLNIRNEVSKRGLIDLFRSVEESEDTTIIHNNLEPLTSLDFLESEFSAVVDHRWTDVVGGRLIKLVLWYDNEYGYSTRVVDQVKYIQSKE